jgi:hypothetical protein
MEIMIKEALGNEAYQIAYKKYEKDPEAFEKPEFQLRRSIVRLPYSVILMYKIMEAGDIEPEKKEIMILTPYGTYYTDYDKKVHKYLADTLDTIEKETHFTYTNEDNED